MTAQRGDAERLRLMTDACEKIGEQRVVNSEWKKTHHWNQWKLLTIVFAHGGYF